MDMRRRACSSMVATTVGGENSRRTRAAPLRRASPAQRSYMVALRKRCRQNGPSPFAPAVAEMSANGPPALQHITSPQSHPAPASSASKASRALASSRRPPAFSPDWVPKPRQITSTNLSGAADVMLLQPSAPPPSELQALERASSVAELQASPPGVKRKRSRTPDGDWPENNQPRVDEDGGSVAVIHSGGAVEVWNGDEWDRKERAEVLQDQLAVERAARVEAERRVRELEHRLHFASEEATRHATATVKRLTTENQRLVQRLAAAASK